MFSSRRRGRIHRAGVLEWLVPCFGVASFGSGAVHGLVTKTKISAIVALTMATTSRSIRLRRVVT